MTSYGSIAIDVKFLLVNPLAFPLGIRSFTFTIMYDDMDGTAGSPWYPTYKPKTIQSGGAVELFTLKTDWDTVIEPAQSKWTPYMRGSSDGTKEAFARLFDEFWTKSRLCAHLFHGHAQVSLTPNTKTTTGHSAPFVFSFPFKLNFLSMVGDYACDATPKCDIFFPKPNNPKVDPIYAPLPSGFAQEGKWSKVGEAKFSAGRSIGSVTNWLAGCVSD